MVVVVWMVGFLWVVGFMWWVIGACGGCGMDGEFFFGGWMGLCGGKWLFLLLPRRERDGNDEKEGKEERKRKR